MLRFINSFCKFTVELHLVETLKQLSNDFKSFVTDSSPPSNQSNLNYQLTISSNVNKSIIEFSRVQIDLWVGFNWINESMNQWINERVSRLRQTGQQFRKPICVQVLGQQKMPEEYCSGSPPPQVQMQPCQTQCILRLIPFTFHYNRLFFYYYCYYYYYYYYYYYW